MNKNPLAVRVRVRICLCFGLFAFANNCLAAQAQSRQNTCLNLNYQKLICNAIQWAAGGLQ